MRLDYFLDESIFNGDIGIFVNQARVQGTTRRHAHDFIEIAYIQEGSGLHRMEQSESECEAGDYFIINYNVPHEFVSRDGMTVCNCIFTPGFIDYSMLGCKDFNIITSNYLLGTILPFSGWHLSDMKFHDDGELSRVFCSMLREYTDRRTGYAELLRSCVVELLIHTLRQAEQSLSFAYGKKSNINDALAFMQKNFRLTVPLEELAMISFLSPAHFCRQFKLQTGMTVTEFRQKLRIEEAKRLLVGTDRSVGEIAESVGYQNLKYFSALFRQNGDLSPAQFRKKYSGERGR